jgi:AcrR family transcriptional regulator
MSPIGRPAGVTAEQTRVAVLAAAAAEFSERGYTRSSIRRIAERAGLTSAAIYYHFPTKLACLEAVQRDALEIMRSYWEPIMARDGHIIDRIAQLLKASALINREHPHMARISALTLMEDAASHPEMSEVARPVRAYSQGVFDRLVADAVTRGELPDVSCAQAVHDMISGLMYGLANTAALQQPIDRYSAAIDALCELLAGRLFTAVDRGPTVGGRAEP